MNRWTEKIEAMRRAGESAAADHSLRNLRIGARQAWVRQAIRELKEAQRRADEAWDRALAALGDDPDEDVLAALPDPPEQAELDRLHAELDAVRTRDLWPRFLYCDEV